MSQAKSAQSEAPAFDADAVANAIKAGVRAPDPKWDSAGNANPSSPPSAEAPAIAPTSNDPGARALFDALDGWSRLSQQLATDASRLNTVLQSMRNDFAKRFNDQEAAIKRLAQEKAALESETTRLKERQREMIAKLEQARKMWSDFEKSMKGASP